MSTHVVIYSDNQSAQKLALNPVHRSRTRHIDDKIRFVREKVKDKNVELMYMPTDRLRVNAVTKPLGSFNHLDYCIGMGLT